VYPQVAGAYPKGAAWNGLISVTKSPSGAEPTALYANNHKYLSMMSVEELGGSIEAYMYPDEFAACNGEAELVPGVHVGQQKRVPFGLCYRNLIGSDTDGNAHGYKLNLIYGAQASPSEETDTTVNDNPEAKTMSWDFNTTPVEVTGFEPTSCIEIDSTKVDAGKLAALEAILYGSDDEEARLPLPNEVATLLGGAA
jgi:hypothetical protein